MIEEDYRQFFAGGRELDGDALATFFLEQKRMEFLRQIVSYVKFMSKDGERKQVTFKIKNLYDFDRKNDCGISPAQKKEESTMVRVGSHVLKKADSSNVDFIKGLIIKIDDTCGKKASKRYIATIVDDSFLHMENPLFIRERAGA